MLGNVRRRSRSQAYGRRRTLASRIGLAIVVSSISLLRRGLDHDLDAGKILADFMAVTFKRAKSSEATFGDATFHREKVAQLINL